MRNNIIRYILIIIFCGIIAFLARIVAIYIIIGKENKIRIEQIKNKRIEGVVTDNLYVNEEKGYDYVTGEASFIFGKYFFENNNQINLEIGDSVSKVPNELVLKIFRKDESGQYKYIGTSK